MWEGVFLGFHWILFFCIHTIITSPYQWDQWGFCNCATVIMRFGRINPSDFLFFSKIVLAIQNFLRLRIFSLFLQEIIIIWNFDQLGIESVWPTLGNIYILKLLASEHEMCFHLTLSSQMSVTNAVVVSIMQYVLLSFQFLSQSIWIKLSRGKGRLAYYFRGFYPRSHDRVTVKQNIMAMSRWQSKAAHFKVIRKPTERRGTALLCHTHCKDAALERLL